MQSFCSVLSSLAAKSGKHLQQVNRQFSQQFTSVSFSQKLYFSSLSLLSPISEGFFPADPDILNDLPELGLPTARNLTS